MYASVTVMWRSMSCESSFLNQKSIKTMKNKIKLRYKVYLKYYQAETDMVKLKIEKVREIDATAAKGKAEIETAAARMKLEKELDIAKAHLQSFKENDKMSQDLELVAFSEKEDSQVSVQQFLEFFSEQEEIGALGVLKY